MLLIISKRVSNFLRKTLSTNHKSLTTQVKQSYFANPDFLLNDYIHTECNVSRSSSVGCLRLDPFDGLKPDSSSA